MADAPNAKGPWALDAGAEYRAVPGPHGPEELLWSVQRRESFAHLDEALDALADIAEQIAAKGERVSGSVEIRHQGARLLYVPFGARGSTRVSPATAVERLEAICEAAGTLFAPVEAGPGRFRRRGQTGS